MPGFSPTSTEVRSHLENLAARHSKLLRLRTVEHTGQGRPIDVATVTDPATAAADKQHVLIVAGQHGNEESGRMVALALLDWLVGSSAAAAQTRRRQVIAVMPNVNPDGAEADSYATPAGIKPNLDHAPSGATTPEGRAVEAIAHELQPELFVDMHSRGHAGCSHDMVLFPVTRDYTEDSNLLHGIAQSMCRAGERSGIPHVTHPLTWDGWGGRDPDQPSTTLFAYRNFKSIVLLTENAEDNQTSYPLAQRKRSGMNRLRTLLAMGNARDPRLPYEGYPYGLVLGMFSTGIVAAGQTAQKRRQSRIEIWRNAPAFAKLSCEIPEYPERASVQVHYNGATLTAGLGVYIRRSGRRTVAGVRHNGRAMRPGEERGYRAWFDGHCTCVVAAVDRLSAGEHKFVFEFQ